MLAVLMASPAALMAWSTPWRLDGVDNGADVYASFPSMARALGDSVVTQSGEGKTVEAVEDHWSFDWNWGAHYQFINDTSGRQQSDWHSISVLLSFDIEKSSGESGFHPYVRAFGALGNDVNERTITAGGVSIATDTAVRAGIVPGLTYTSKVMGIPVAFTLGAGYVLSEHLTPVDESIDALRTEFGIGIGAPFSEHVVAWAFEFYGSRRLDEFSYTAYLGSDDWSSARLSLGYKYQGTDKYKLGALTIGVYFPF